MADGGGEARGVRVPSGRLTRLARIGGVAGGIAGGAALRGAAALARGERPSLGALLLTPANVGRLTDELARMRGAAMKLGQLLSMDAGEMLPRELADILARLRAEAAPMPPRQLRAVLDAAWGRDWLRRFERFDVRPIAAASIGQVHRAQTRDGRDLAIKVQYPGVRRSIDSDVDNVGALIRLSGLAPGGLDLAPMLAEAKRQLHEEADYAREAAQMTAYAGLLAGDPGYVAPAPQPDLTTPEVLAMTFVAGAPVESRDAAPQAERDRIAALAVGLLFRELFAFRLVQTDPNFANYRWDGARLVLLDFGAVRAVPGPMAEACRRLTAAALREDRAAMEAEALGLGLFGAQAAARHRAMVLDLIALASEPLRRAAPFDFGDRGFAARLRAAGMALAADPDVWHAPPMDVLYLQRKVAGVFLLGARLKARVDLRALLAPHLPALDGRA